MGANSDQDGPLGTLDTLLVLFRMSQVADIDALFAVNLRLCAMLNEHWFATPFVGLGFAFGHFVQIYLEKNQFNSITTNGSNLNGRESFSIGRHGFEIDN